MKLLCKFPTHLLKILILPQAVSDTTLAHVHLGLAGILYTSGPTINLIPQSYR